MNEYEMMKNSPKELFDFYMNILLNGGSLNDDQLIKYEYLKKILIKDSND